MSAAATGPRSGRKAEVSFSANFVVGLAVYSAGTAALIGEQIESPALHTILDTAVAVTGTLVAFLLADVGARTRDSWPIFLAIAFSILAVAELVHAIASLEWFGGAGGLLAVQWRAGTWGPPAHVLPLGVGAALLLRKRDARLGWLLAIGLLAAATALFALFQNLPRYTPPTFLGITRPTLVLVPLLWIGVGLLYWGRQAESETACAIALTALLLTLAHCAMLYSRAPNDAAAMAAHLGKFVGDAMLLLSLIQIGATDSARRRRVEDDLLHANRMLDERVRERTAQLESANSGLREEAARREEADRKLRTQLERLNLLSEITRAVGERQDMRSVFQVAVRSPEDELPADFVAVLLYERETPQIIVEHVGVKSAPLAADLSMPERARIEVDQNGLARCVRGELVHEPDTRNIAFPFPQKLAGSGLRSLVVAPLLVESDGFGVLVVARAAPYSFDSTDCEFLRQLSGHVALAAHQGRLHSSLQKA